MTNPSLTTVKGIVLVLEMPAQDKRDPSLIYIDVSEGSDERDRVLGKFMHLWSEVETLMLSVLWKSLDAPYNIAEAIFYSAQNIRAQLDLIASFIAMHDNDKQAVWTSLRQDILELSNDRNRLVHGRWLPEITVAIDSDNHTEVTHIAWARVYMSGNFEQNHIATLRPGQNGATKKQGQFRYDLARVERKIVETTSIAKRLNTFRSSFDVKRGKPPITIQ